MELGLEGSWQYFSDGYKNVLASMRSRTRKLPNGHFWTEQRNNKWNVVHVKALHHLPTRFFSLADGKTLTANHIHSLNGVNATKGAKVILTGNGDYWKETLPSLMLFVPFLKSIASKKVQEEEFAIQGQ
jgi:hypothetical protein